MKLQMVCSGIFAVMLMMVSEPAQAYDFDKADALFAKRGEGAEAILGAVAEYEKSSAASLSQDEEIYAAVQVARLHAYRAQLISRETMAERVQPYQACMDAAATIKTIAEQNDRPEYFFWQGACWALWGEAKGMTHSLEIATEVIAILEQGRRIDPTYEGGGFDRVLGAVYAKLPPFNPNGPSGDPEKAVRHLEQSIDSPPYSRSENPEYESGDYFFETYFYLASALKRQFKFSEARDVKEDALARIADEDINPDRLPETRIAEDLLRSL